MAKRRTRALPAQVEEVRRRLDGWRRARKHRARLPEELWASAVKLVAGYGLHKTARALRLDYYALKKRVESASRQSPSEPQGATAFMELVGRPVAGASECVVELQNRRGAKMRIQLKGISPPDLAALSKSFWSVRR